MTDFETTAEVASHPSDKDFGPWITRAAMYDERCFSCGEPILVGKWHVADGTRGDTVKRECRSCYLGYVRGWHDVEEIIGRKVLPRFD